MKHEKLFIDENLPDPLTKEEFLSYLEKYKQGDLNARNEIINHNIKLVIYQVLKKFSKVPYEKEELVAIGLVGLIKSLDTYDVNRGIEFNTYALKFINNEILIFLRKQKKYRHDKSIYEPIKVDESGVERTIEDSLEYETPIFESTYEKEILNEEIRKEIYKLPRRNREIILMFFGFYNDHCYNQQEISESLGISQSYVSRIIRKNVKKLGIQLKENGTIETSGAPSKMIRNVKTNKRNNNIKNKKGNTSQAIEVKEKKKRISNIKKEDYVMLLNLMKTPPFENILKTLSPKEVVILYLEFGFVDGKCYNAEAIADILKIKKEEVIEITKKVLLLAKEHINRDDDTNIEVSHQHSLNLIKKEQ